MTVEVVLLINVIGAIFGAANVTRNPSALRVTLLLVNAFLVGYCTARLLS